MRVAILNISIGDYTCFWEDFYKTAQENFLIDCDKEYFVFTDAPQLYGMGKSHIHIYSQEDLGWPLNTMMRFDFFNNILVDLLDFDYIFFVNANAVFSYPITSKIIISCKDIVTVEHPGFHYRKKHSAPFERRSKSRAYVPLEKDKIYVQGAFYGGKRDAFFALTEELDKLTKLDLAENIVAVWHDESFLNHYVAYHDNVQVLGWQYLKYEECIQPYKPIIVLRNKRKYINNKNGRFLNENFLKKDFCMFVRNIKWQILIFLRWYKKCSIWDSNGNYIDLDVKKD